MSGISDSNPFVGPRPIQPGEALYGRAAEIRELYNRLQARRIVVLHSPSGAGKSSLVQAGLIPKLQANKFDVWKPIRVNFDPAGLEGVPEHCNRYSLSAMLSLEEELPADHRRSPAQLAGLSFADYLASRPRRKGRVANSVVLIFDQFEEVLTLAPQAIEQKREFFTAIGEALGAEQYWALFVIREDFLAAFAPYRDKIPTQLSNTFRLDLLGLEGAREAAKELALVGGRSFPGVDQLIRDLSAIQVQRPDGSFVAEQGHYVEPVQLQVVCRRLWTAMPAEDLSIDAEDIVRYADVSTALGGYYAESVAAIAKGQVTVERKLRDWVANTLIVAGIRSQVRQEAGQSAGLDNQLIDQLMNCYLVRNEQRGGANWFELSHDRLVQPIQQNNEAWEREHLHPLQVQAKLWEHAGRPPELLLNQGALLLAKVWAELNDEIVTEGEREFLAESSALRAKERASRRRLIAAVIVAILVAIVMSVMMQLARMSKAKAEVAQHEAEVAQTEADAARREAQLAQKAAQTASLMAGASELLARNRAGAAAMVLAEMKTTESVRGWAQLVADILMRDTARSTFTHRRAVRAAAWSPDGERIVTASADHSARIWTANRDRDPTPLVGHDDEVLDAQWSPDGEHILTTSADHSARIWTLEGACVRVLEGHEGAVVRARWSPDGTKIATASVDGSARIWSSEGDEAPLVLRGHTKPLTSLEWSPDGHALVTSSADMQARVWAIDDSGSSIVLTGHVEQVLSAVWSPDGTKILTASMDDTARIWNADGSGEPLVFSGHLGSVFAASWSHDGERIATASEDGSARMWNADGKGEATSLAGHENWVVSVEWSHDDKHIVTASMDSTARVWNTDGSGNPMLLSSHKKDVVSATWSPRGEERILTASSDRSARVWDMDSSDKPLILEGHQGWVYCASWSPILGDDRIVTSSGGGRVDAQGNRDNSLRIWSSGGKAERILTGHTGWVYSAMWSPDATRIVSASGDMSARIWNADGSGEPIVLTGHTDQVRHAAWDHEGKRIVTASTDETARIWTLDGSAPPLVLRGHTGPLRSAVFSPDGTKIVTASIDASAAIWTADGSGEPIFLRGHDDQVMFAGWSPDGTKIVTASADMTARIWTADGSPTDLVLRGHDEVVISAQWSPDSTKIVTASEDKSAWVWTLDPSDTPIRLTGHEDRIMFADWSPDGTKIVTASIDRSARIWQLGRYSDLAKLKLDLFDTTTDCLSVDQRKIYLLENEGAARAGYEACEIAYGQTPYFDALETHP